MTTSTEIVPTEDTGSYYSNASKFELMMRIATSLSKSQLVPQIYQHNIPNCMIALDIADRSGESPFIVMQNLFIIHNKPGFGSAYLIGGINKSGRFTPLRFHFSGKDDEWSCMAWAFPKSAAQNPSIRDAISACASPLDAEAKGLPVLKGTTVSIGIAKQEGWFGKAGSKWKVMPELMLQYRAATWFCRMYAPDIAMGMKTQEEVIDVHAPAETVHEELTPVRGRKGIAAAKLAEVVPMTAEPEPPPAEEKKPEPAPEPPKAEAEAPKSRTRKPADKPKPPAEPEATNPDLEAAPEPTPERKPAAPAEERPKPEAAQPPPAPAQTPAPEARQAEQAEFDDESEPPLPPIRDEIIEVTERPTTKGPVYEISTREHTLYWSGKKQDIPALGSVCDFTYENRLNKHGKVVKLASAIAIVG